LASSVGKRVLDFFIWAGFFVNLDIQIYIYFSTSHLRQPTAAVHRIKFCFVAVTTDSTSDQVLLRRSHHRLDFVRAMSPTADCCNSSRSYYGLIHVFPREHGSNVLFPGKLKKWIHLPNQLGNNGAAARRARRVAVMWKNKIWYCIIKENLKYKR
jgi:hypothetical protein